MCVKNHGVPWCFGRGHILKVEQRSHYRMICRCVVRWIIANGALVRVPMSTLAPHSQGGAAVCPVLHSVKRRHLPWYECYAASGSGARDRGSTYITARVSHPSRLPEASSRTLNACWSKVTWWLSSRSKPRASCPQGPWICHTRAAYKFSPVPPWEL